MPGTDKTTPLRRSPADEPRMVRTREALEAGLWQLLRDHDLAEISVAGLCRRAEVHRTTFYGHYPNIFDFAASVYADVVDRLGTVELDQRGTGRTIGEIGDLYVESIRQILQHTKTEERVYRTLFATGAFLTILADQLKARILLALHVWRAHGATPALLDLDATAAFLGGAYASWFEEWVAGDEDDVEARLGSLHHLLPAWWPRDGFPPAP